MARLTEVLRRKLRQHAELVLGEVHRCDESLLRPAGPHWNFLGELEYGGAAILNLFP